MDEEMNRLHLEIVNIGNRLSSKIDESREKMAAGFDSLDRTIDKYEKLIDELYTKVN